MSFGLEHLFLHNRPATRGQRMIRGVILAIAAVIAVVIFVFLTRRAQVTAGWRATPCRVVSSGVDVSDTEEQSPYRFSVAFAYAVNGMSFLASTYSDGITSSDDAASMYALARRLPEGTDATCYVDPSNPQRALMVLPNVRRWEAATAAVVVLAAALLFFYCIPQFTRPEPIPVRGRRSGVERVYVAVAVIACAGGVGWMCVWPLMQNASAAVWMPVPAVVEHARLRLEQLHGELPLTLYRTDLLYRYTVAGIEYHSNQYSLTEIESPLASGRRKRVAQLAAEPRLVCYVDPRHPESAVLTRRISPTQWLSAWPTLFGMLGVYTLIPRHRRTRIDAALRRSRWTIAGCLLLLAILTGIGLTVMP